MAKLSCSNPREKAKKTIFEVLIDGEKVGYGSSKNKDIAKLNAARDAHEKLNLESNLSIKAHKDVEDGEKSTLQAPTIPHSQHRLAALGPLLSLSFSSPHKKIETKEKKEYHSVELKPTRDERDKIEEVRKERAAKQKLNELCMKRHWPPIEYQSKTKGTSTEGQKGKGEGHMTDPPQHQHLKPALSPVLTALAQPAPGNKECSVSPKRRGRKKLTTALTQFCQKNGKVVEFKTSREGKNTTISEVLVDGEKVGYGSSKHKNIAKLNAARDALEKLNGEKSNLSIKVHKEVEDGEKSSLRALTIPHSQHRLAALGPLPTLSFSSPHEKIGTKEKKEYHYVELRPTKDERDKIEEVRKETAAKQKLNKLCMKRHWPPPKYQSETKGMSVEGEKGKGEGHMVDPLQHQHSKPALSLVLTASAQPAPGYNVTVEEGRERREKRVSCCRINIGWLLFILGFFLRGIPWRIGAIMLFFSRVDYRKKPGYIGCTIALVLATIASCLYHIGAIKGPDDW